MNELRELRRQACLTQAELGTALKLSPSTIGMYEQGRRAPDNELLVRMADYFGVTTDFLLGRATTSIAPAESIEGRVAKMLRQHRKEMGLTQTELAKKAGISRTHYACIETGRYVLSLKVLAKLCEILNLEICFRDKGEVWE